MARARGDRNSRPERRFGQAFRLFGRSPPGRPGSATATA